MKRMLLRMGLALVIVALLAAPAAAQNRTAPATPGGWHEQATEFGTAQSLYQDIIDGEARAFEAKFYLNTLYNHAYGPDKGVTYFMFALDTQRTPLVGSFNELIDGTTGNAIPIYRVEEEQGGKLIKWIVDVANMPAPGAPIVMRGTIGSTGAGQYQAGALLQPFNYKWDAVQTSSGTPAQLYIFTQYGVNRATQEGCEGALCDVVGKVTPAGPIAGALAAVAVGAYAWRRRR